MKDLKYQELADFNSFFFALDDSFEWLYDVDIETGSYRQYVKGMTFSETVNTKLIERGDFFADTLENVELVVYEEDRPGFIRVVNRDYIRKTLSAHTHFDWYYRLVADGKTSWFRMRFVYKDNEKRNLIIGIFNAEDEMTSRLRAEQERNDMIGKLAGSESTYIVYPLTDGFTVINQNSYLEDHYPVGETYTCSISRYIDNDIHEEDRKAVSEMFGLANVRRCLEENTENSLLFRDISNGTPRWMEARLVRLSGTEVLVSFSDRSEEVMEEQVFSSLKDSYLGFYYVNLDTGLAHILKTAHPDISGATGTNVPYGPLMRKMASYSEGEAGEFLTEISEAESLKARFSTESHSFYSFRSSLLPEDRWISLTCVVLSRHADGIPFQFAIGFTLLDEEACEKETAKVKLKESMEVVGGLATEFTALYYVNLDTDEYTPYHLIAGVDDIRPYYAKYPKFTDLAHAFADSGLVRDEDREALHAFYPSAADVKEALSGRKRNSMLFKRNYDGQFLWTEINLVKCEDESENAHRVIVGFLEKDKEVTERAQRFVEAEEANLLIENIAQKYNLAYVINMADDSFQVVRIDENILGQDRSFKVFSDIRTFFLEEVVHPADRERMRRELDYSCIRQRFGTSKSYVVEYRALVNGASNWNEMIVTLVKDDDIAIGFALKDLEITKQRLEDKRFEEYLAFFLVDLDTEMIKPLKTSELFKTANVGEAVPYEMAMKIFADSCEGETKELVTPLTSIEYIRQELAVEDKRMFSFRTQRFEGANWIDISIYTILRHEDGSPAVFSLGFTRADSRTTERQELQLQIKETQKQLQEALAMAQSASRAKTTFLNNMSHDIRTPMNAIIGYTGLAVSHIDNKDLVQDYLFKIGQSSDHLLSLINDVLDMSRIESGKINLEEKEEDLSEIIHTLKNIVQANVRVKHLDFLIDAIDIDDEVIVCDKLRLNQVLLNVLSNAIKYTPAGGLVSLKVSERTVSPNGYGEYEFRIKDNGIGMTPEFLKTIFKPFTRANSATVSGIQGTGLGMAITKNLVDMLGGKIAIESELGKGTEVVITFYFKIQKEKSSLSHLSKLEGLRALIVDDDADTCMYVAKMLRDVGMRSLWCLSGKEAVLRAQDAYKSSDLYKVFIIDWLLPDMNGIETARRIRKVVGDDIPIIILTAYDWSDIEEEGKEAGVTAFVSKPLFPSELTRILGRCLGDDTDGSLDEKDKFDFTGKKILLVEDNLLNAEIATEILKEYGCTVTQAEDGSVAVEKMTAASQGDYDLILMDIQMPVMNGYEATRQIRALGTEVSKIPILAMTANAFEEDRKAAIESGMNEHIAKPIDIDTLKVILSRFL